MSLQTRVLVDGVWTTRNVDLQTVLERNREHKTKKPMDTPEMGPTMGLLTKTIVQSPVCIWILPARIRHKTKNDVLFIGESSVQIKELHPNGHLQEVATKIDFPARITNARIIGQPRKIPLSHLDSYLKKEDTTEDADPFHSEDNFNPEFYLVEDRDSIFPPQILVLALDSGEILFIFAFENANGTVGFSIATKPLFQQHSDVDTPAHVAVDPRSRALAVASRGGRCVLYALHSFDKMRQDVDRNGTTVRDSFGPVREERHLHVDGSILRMEFLFPPLSDKCRVILLLVVCKDHQTRLLLYEWDSTTSLRTVEQQGYRGLPVDKNDRLPLLVIPLTISSAFLLVSRTKISLYTGILTGTFERKFLGKISSNKPTGIAPLKGAWARPARTGKFSSNEDCLYLCREDGLLFFIAIDKNDTYLVKSVAPCGSLRGCVNKAFAVLDIELNQSDLLIVGGDMSAGGLYMIPPKQREVECVEAIPDWTPMLDFASVHRLPGELAKTNDFNDPSTVSASIHRDRIFACTGQGEHGSISEIRHGFEGRIGLILDYQAGINQIWSFANQQTRGIYLLCSLPLLTEVLYVSADLRTVEQKGAADVEGLDLDSRTLMATSFGDAVVQVTGHSIRATLGILNAEQPRSTHCFLKCSPDESIIYASLHESTLSILTIVQSAERFRLHLAQLQRETGKLSIAEVGSPVILASSPSSLFAAQIGGNLYAFVGDSECNMQIHYCDARDGPQLHCTQSVKNNPYDDTFAICESATVLRCKSSENIQAMSLVCGLRNGTMTTFDLHLANSTGEIHLSDQTTYQVGDTSVQILDDRVNEDAAFVICGQYLFRLIFEPDATVRHLIKDIWLTDRNEPSYRQSSVSALTQISLGHHHSGAEPGGLLACMIGDQLVLADLELLPKMVPRHMAVGGTPKRVMFSAHLGLLVVAYTTVGWDPSFRNFSVQKQKRVNLSLLRFVDPNDGPLDFQSCNVNFYGTNDRDGRPQLGKPGEKIFSMIDWFCVVNEHTYYFLVVGTGVTSDEDSSQGPRGRVLFLSVTRMGDGELRVKQKFAIAVDAPVYALASYGHSSLVFSFGHEISVRSLDWTSKKFVRVAQHELKSPCLRITTDAPYIYITTLMDSTVILTLHNGTLIRHFSDTGTRIGQAHLALLESQVLLVSDRARCVTGLWYPFDGPRGTSLQTVFEAELPSTIFQLRLATLRLPWRPRSALPGVHNIGNEGAEIIGCGLNGSLFQFLVLSEQAWRLLRFIQNLSVRNVTIHPFPEEDRVASHIEPQETSPRSKHVDGDALGRLVASGSATLREMLDAKPRSEINGKSVMDFNSAAARMRRFSTLVKELLGEESGDPVAAAMEYVEALLTPVI